MNTNHPPVCCVCKSDMCSTENFFENAVTSDNQFIPVNLSYNYCNTCGYIEIAPESRIDCSKFYTDDYNFLLTDDDVEPELQGKSTSSYSVEFFGKYIENAPNKSFFDIGAGKGNILSSFHSAFPSLKYYGLEPSPAYKKLAQKKFLAESYNKFFSADEFGGRTFDYLSIVTVFEHVDNPLKFLVDIKKIMHKSSLLLVEVPNFARNKYDLLTADHLSEFYPENIKNLFHVAGFEVLDENIGSGLSMKYIVKISNHGNQYKFITTNSKEMINTAKDFISEVIKDVSSLKDEKVAFYGQSIILDYLLGSKRIHKDQVPCIIDDNSLYQGKKHKGEISIISFEDFQKKEKDSSIFLAMNDCYHPMVLPKIPATYKVIGTFL